MMKHITPTLFLILGSLFTKAQVDKMNISWSENMKSRKMLVTDVMSIGNPEEFFAINHSFKTFNRNTFLERYDNLSLMNQMVLTEKYDQGVHSSQNIIALDKNLFALNLRRSKIDVSLKAQQINSEDLSLEGEEKSIYNIKLIKGHNHSMGEYKNAKSLDEQKITYVIGHPGDMESKEIMTIKVFDHFFREEWKTRITFPFEKGLTRLQSVNISNSGIVYILTTVYNSRKERNRRTRNFENYVIVVDSNGIVAEHKLELEDKFIRELKLNVGEGGDLICGGFYSDEGFHSDGIFYMTLDANDFIIKHQSMKPFDLDFIVQGLSDRAKAKTIKKSKKGKNVGLTHVQFRDFIPKKNGGALLVGEYIHIFTTNTTNANGFTTTTTHYHYDDIYAISINPEGDIEWAKKIQKMQHTSNDGGFYSSFFTVINDDIVNFIYNSYNRKENHLKVSSINGYGTIKHENLVSNHKRENLRIRPKSCEQVSDNTFVIFATSRKSYRLAKVTLD
ncbi:MAG: hypothetical protein L7V85_04325 [Bacteroidia bacterium]|nr:hypothetical protein [Bacteroidia bacterium]